MSTGVHLGYTKPFDFSARDASSVFHVANATDDLDALADDADRLHLTGDLLLVVVEVAKPEEAIARAQVAGVEADVWAVPSVKDADHAARIAAAATAGGRDNVACVHFGNGPGPTEGVAGWRGVLRPL